jgi:hypothetical protein
MRSWLDTFLGVRNRGRIRPWTRRVGGRAGVQSQGNTVGDVGKPWTALKGARGDPTPANAPSIDEDYEDDDDNNNEDNNNGNTEGDGTGNEERQEEEETDGNGQGRAKRRRVITLGGRMV